MGIEIPIPEELIAKKDKIPEIGKGWACASCGKINKMKNNKCMICGNDRIEANRRVHKRRIRESNPDGFTNKPPKKGGNKKNIYIKKNNK